MLDIIPLISSAIYFGSAAYITLVEHPARIACSPEIAWAQWAQSVKRTPRYAASAIVAAVTALIYGKAALASPWTWGSILLLAVLPFTAAVLLPIQRQVTESGRAFEPVEARTVLERWGRLHLVRTCLGLCAFMLFLWQALKAQ